MAALFKIMKQKQPRCPSIGALILTIAGKHLVLLYMIF